MKDKEKLCYRFTTATDNNDYCMGPGGVGGVKTKCKGNIKLCTEKEERDNLDMIY